MANKLLYTAFPAFLLASLLFPTLCPGQQITIHTSRKIDTLGSGGPHGPDTLGVTLRYFAEGTYDTIWAADTTYDTNRVPIDVVLALDLSTSMSWVDSTIDSTKRARIVWTKLAALHFLDSLKTGDRVAVMGWTAVGTPAGLADTAYPLRYFHKWCEFTAGFNGVRSFIRDSIFIDSTVRIVDTCESQVLVVRDNIPGAFFTSTPMHISTVVTAKHLSSAGRLAATRAVIMLTDGVNNDQLAQSVPVSLLDSLYRTKAQRFFAIGFIAGDTAGLRALTNAGGGACYNAAEPRQLDSIYALLAKQLVNQRIDTMFTLRPIRISPDTVRQPIDVMLAIDLSGSMDTNDNTAHTRLVWAKIAALGFLDSLGPQDRVSVLGWTSSVWGSVFLSDTSDPNTVYLQWCPFTANFDSVRNFIYDSLFIDDDDGFWYDTINGRRATVLGNTPGPYEFGYTPLHLSAIQTMSHLSSSGRRGATKVVIMLTDGINNDGVSHSYTVNYVDSLRRTEGLQMHTIGFIDGDTAELHSLATAGGGNFYNAKNNIEMQSAFASLAHQLVTEKLAARKLTIQEALNCPPLYFMAGTQSSTVNSTVPLEKTEVLIDGKGNWVLRWYFKTIPIWGIAEAYYKIVAAQGANTAIGIDSAHAGGGYWSRMVYTDNDYQVITIGLPVTGSTPLVSVRPKGDVRFQQPDIAFMPGRVVRVRLAENRSVAMTLYNLSGRVVFRDAAQSPSAGSTALFRVPGTVPAGVYAACFTFEDRTMRYLMNILK